MVLLNTNTSETNLRLLASSLTTNTSLRVLGQVEEDLTVKHTIFVQVEDLGVSRLFGFLNFFLLLFFLLLFCLLLFKFLFP